MGPSPIRRKSWLAPVGIGVAGVLLSCLAFWMADEADDERVRTVLELRSEWRARDLEAKIRLSANAVENVAIAMAVDSALNPDQFRRLASRAMQGLSHVNALQWAPRVKREEIAPFEQRARAMGLKDYRVFDVTPDFQRTELSDRPEYFPVLFDERPKEGRRVFGLALGKHDPRRIPMEMARDEGVVMGTAPVRPIGPTASGLVYLLFWPVYDTIDVPSTVDDRRVHLRGYAVGNYDLAALIEAALRNTPEPIETLYFGVGGGAHQHDPAASAHAVYSLATRRVEVRGEVPLVTEDPAFRMTRDFNVFGQHWDLTFDYSADAVASLRSSSPWVWLLGGLLTTALLVLYLWREMGRTRAIQALVETRTAELERTSEQLHQAQKMEAIGNLTGGMAHDFNNLLSVVIGNLDLLQDRVKSDSEAMALSESALQASIRGAELTRQLLAFARRQPLAPSVVDVNELVAGMIRLLERILEENIEVVLNTGRDIWPVLIDPAQLSAAVTNLATNARDAMPEGGRLTIETKNAHLDADYVALNPEADAGDYVLLEVSDTGTGMSPETLSQVFEPFFTTKEVGRGTGLGLSMVFGFVKQSKGHIKIYSELGHGTIVRLYLPRGAQGPVTVAAAADTVLGHAASESILVVEDDNDVRRIVIKQIAELGYVVIEARSPKEALALLKDPRVKIDLLFTDLVMPGGMNGHELARAAIAERSGLKALFTSGYSDSSLRGDERLGEDEHFLSKPYRKQDLARKLQEIFSR
jgi:signal transduction histidine kinase/ActR/RegA family two-component response regulator